MSKVLENEFMKDADPYMEKFKRFETREETPSWVLPLRKAGIASFEEQGFPTLKDEDWRFTNVAPIARLPFEPAFEPAVNADAAGALKNAPLGNFPGCKLVFVDGHFAKDLSSAQSVPDGVKITSLAAALREDPALLEKHLSRYAQTQENTFAALNQAFFLDGAFIYVPARVTVEQPVQLVFISSAGKEGQTIQPRNLLIAEANSSVTVLESYLSTGSAAYFSNAVTEISAGENAFVEWVKLQDEAPEAFHVATIQGRFDRNSRVNVHSFALGARLSRNNIRAKLAGEGLECVLNGLYVTKDDQLADHHMIVEHAEPHCASHEYFNGILDDRSRGVFHGRILVQQIAQKTDAKQTNKNLLLSDNASVDTKPQLEIYADDVKCTHGATIGQLNDESIFYLRSRGLSAETAKRMLVHAFAGEIIERIRFEPAREVLDQLVWDRIEANPHVGERK